MRNYLGGVNEDIIREKGIDGVQLIEECGCDPRLVVKYKVGGEFIIDGDVEIEKFVASLK